VVSPVRKKRPVRPTPRRSTSVFLVFCPNALKCVNAGSIDRSLVQLIPSINYSIWKKILAAVHSTPKFSWFPKCPLSPLTLTFTMKSSPCLSSDKPLYILKTSMRYCLFILGLSVYSYKQCSLSSYEWMKAVERIKVSFHSICHLLWTFKINSLSFYSVDCGLKALIQYSTWGSA